jgi:rSAM/selenodomain-associated transferase 1
MSDTQIVNAGADAGRIALILVAKEAVAGRVKTRLTPQLSAQNAAQVYRVFLKHVRRVCEQTANRDQHLQLVLLFDPPHSIESWHAWSRWLKVAQSAGDLGDRLRQGQNTLAETHAGGCLFLGADAPELTTDQLLWAAREVRRGYCIMIPSNDGGYVVIGMPTGGPALFDGITWSTAMVAAQTREAATRQGAEMKELPPVADIDHPDDLANLLARLQKSSSSADITLRRELMHAIRPTGASALSEQ